MVSLTLTDDSKDLTPELHTRKQRSIADIFRHIQATGLIEEDKDYIYFGEEGVSPEELLSTIQES